MSTKDKEYKKYIEDIRKFTTALLKSEEETRDFFVKAGIHTKSGNLTSRYSDKTNVTVARTSLVKH